MLALGEALLLAGRAGIAPTVLIDFCASLGALAPAIEAAIRPPSAARSLAAGHRLGTIIEDLDAALALASAAGIAAPFATQCREEWAAMQRDLGPEADYAQILRWLETTSAKPKPRAEGEGQE